VTVAWSSEGEEPAQAEFYTLTSGSTGGHPTAWTLEGSDDGDTWQVLDRRTGEAFEWGRYTRPFKLQAPARYRHYRWVFTGASDRQGYSLAELELLGAPESAPVAGQ